MKIKKYEVYEMKDALAQIKKDLGPEAVILSTKKIVKNGNYGLFSKPMIEVTAAVDYQPNKNPVANRVTLNEDTYTPQSKQTPAYENDLDKFTEIINSFGLDKIKVVIDEISEIKKQMSEVKDAISGNLIIDLNENLSIYYKILVKNGVDEVIAYRFLKSFEKRFSDNFSGIQLKSALVQFFAELIPIKHDYFDVMKQKIIAMVGPTGVGKTTTIAKIAANMALKMHKKVCLISIDTFRIGAVEQLKTYADIVDVPLKVASSQDELRQIIMECKDYDYILLDSMGRSQFDQTQIEELESFLSASQLISVVLVLSMSCNHSEILDTYDRYNSLSPEYVIFTKMDETIKFGPVVNLPLIKKIPLLLLTTGQNVPDDMEIPDGKKIAKKVLNEIPTLWRE